MRVNSWNIKGLTSPIKRPKVLSHLKRLKPDIALIQEAHRKGPDFVRMKKLWVGRALGSEAVGRKAGVLMLIHKKLPCEVSSVDSDKQGCFITVRLCIGNRALQISNVYAPNSPSQSFFCELSTKLSTSPHIAHLIGGDLNMVMHHSDDRSTSKHPIRKNADLLPTPFASTIDSLYLTDV